MKKWIVIAGVGAGALALSIVASAQSSSSSGQNVTPAPGTGSGYGSSQATPGMSQGSSGGTMAQRTPVPGRTTPMAGGMSGEAPTGTGPAAKADCANNGWQNYPSQSFQSQKTCESYVRKHSSSKKGTGSHSMSRTPGAGSMSSSSGQGSSSSGQGSTMAPTPQSPQ